MSTDIRSKNQIFYLSYSQRSPTEACRELLQNYAHISPSNLESHIISVRDAAWSHHPFPSIGLFIFLDLGLCGDDLPPHPSDPTALQRISSVYATILQTLQNGGKFLDVGCMFAQDTRKLVYDGAPASSVFGTDLHGEYFDYGYKLFRDEDVIPKEHFIAADILDVDDEGLKPLEGNLDVINATHVIHVFSIEDQLALLKRFISMLKQDKGVMVIGRLTGHDQAGYHMPANAKATTKTGGEIWEHNTESFKKLWRDAEEETGTEWDMKCWMWKFGTHTATGDPDWFRSKENGILTFIATRL